MNKKSPSTEIDGAVTWSYLNLLYTSSCRNVFLDGGTLLP